MRPASVDRIGRAISARCSVGIGDKLHKAATVLESRDEGELYRGLIAQWPQPSELVLGGCEPQICPDDELAGADLDAVERMMARDALGYLPDDILTKVDRAAMANSLETRVPMLDHRVVEFAFGLPLDYKLQGGRTKRILRDVLYRHVPKSLVERPKAGFAVPIDVWLRGPLRDWAESLLSAQRLRRENYLDPAPIQRKWAEHLSGKRNWQHALWNVLMFQAWLETQTQ